MLQSNRREFLKVTASALALAALGDPARAAADTSHVQGWMTSNDKRHQSIAPLQWGSIQVGSPAGIRLNTTQKQQEILGFGGAFTDASCYLLDKLDPRKRADLLSDFFGSSGLRLSVCRTCIGASDYSTAVYSYDDGVEPDPDLKRFSIEHDRAYILPSLRAARAVNSELFLFSTPWSPPGWMKAGGSMLGGSMEKKYLAAYADYFIRFLQEYEKEGVKINAVTIQNEVDTDQDGRMPAALWGQEYEIEFVKRHLGPAIERTSLGTRIWILDHNYNLWGRAVDELSDPGVNRYVDGVAWHGYYGTPDAMSRVHEAFPEKNCYWTEGGPDITSPDYATDWAKWSATFTGALRNWARCIVSWNLLLDEQGKPNIGPFPCGGVVTVNSQSHEITPSGQYWAFAHFSKHIQRGARVIASEGKLADVEHIGFENPDGSHVLVITNRGESQQVRCELNQQALAVNAEKDSVTTLLW
jgi:glucosylceramidase